MVIFLPLQRLWQSMQRGKLGLMFLLLFSNSVLSVKAHTCIHQTSDQALIMHGGITWSLGYGIESIVVNFNTFCHNEKKNTIKLILYFIFKTRFQRDIFI